MNVTIVEVKKTENWDNQISQFNGSLFLYSSFLESIEDSEKKPVFFEFRNGNETIAMLSGIIRPVNKTSEKQLFFFSGIACRVDDDLAFAECKESLINYASQNSYARVIFETYDEINYRKVVSKHIKIARDRSEFVIYLDTNKEEILNGFNPNVRRLARKAKRQGAILKYGQSSTLLNKLYDLMEQTHEERTAKYGNNQITALPFLDYEKLQKLLDDGLAQFCYIEHEQEILCIQYNIVIGNLVYGLLMGTNKKGYKLGAPSMLFHEVIQDYREKGYIRYNLGGVSMVDKKLEGIKKFKLSMGAKMVESKQENTLFLNPPLSRLNFILICKQFISNLKIPRVIKKQLLKLTSLFLKGTDKY